MWQSHAIFFCTYTPISGTINWLLDCKNYDKPVTNINLLAIPSYCLTSLWVWCHLLACFLLSSPLNNPYFHSACICFISSFPTLSLPSFLFLLLQKKSSTGQIQDEPDVQIDMSDLSVDMQRNDLNNHAFLRNASSPAVTCATRHQHRPAKRYRSK